MDPNRFNAVTSYEGPCNEELLPPIEQTAPICVFISTVRNFQMARKISRGRLPRSLRRSPRFNPLLPELSIQEMVDTCPRAFVDIRGVHNIPGYAGFFLRVGTISALECPLTQEFDVQHAREITPGVERFYPNVCRVFTLGLNGFGPVRFFKRLKESLDDGEGPISVRITCNNQFASDTRQGILINPPVRNGYWHMMLAAAWGDFSGQEVLLCQDSQGPIRDEDDEVDVDAAGYIYIAMRMVNLFVFLSGEIKRTDGRIWRWLLLWRKKLYFVEPCFQFEL